MSDLKRLKDEYAAREQRFAESDLYSLSNPAHRFMKKQLQKNVLECLEQAGITNLDSLRVLEVGCGNGNVMVDFQQLGARVENLFGVDLLPARLQQAHERHPSFLLACADGQRLPHQARTFDLVVQFTAFSSILDDAIKRNLAFEMQRVLKPGGVILWYDFWLNPFNRQTHGIRPAEVRQLFQGCTFDFRKITLAPPLTRRLVPLLPWLALFLEELRIFNTHYLVAISRKMESSL
jgi:ubiquinone/menaquinone biosynthesis C-methylase UbiE